MTLSVEKNVNEGTIGQSRITNDNGKKLSDIGKVGKDVSKNITKGYRRWRKVAPVEITSE